MSFNIAWSRMTLSLAITVVYFVCMSMHVCACADAPLCVELAMYIPLMNY